MLLPPYSNNGCAAWCVRRCTAAFGVARQMPLARQLVVISLGADLISVSAVAPRVRGMRATNPVHHRLSGVISLPWTDSTASAAPTESIMSGNGTNCGSAIPNSTDTGSGLDHAAVLRVECTIAAIRRSNNPAVLEPSRTMLVC